MPSRDCCKGSTEPGAVAHNTAFPFASPAMTDRSTALRQWLQALGFADDELRPASGDASFRRYFRIGSAEGRSCVVMDAPPDKEPLDSFLDIGRRLRAAGLTAPEVLARDEAQGFLLLEDLGDCHYLDLLDDERADALYGDAMRAILSLQREVAADDLPPYDETLLRREMELFPEWFVSGLLGLRIDAAQRASWRQITELLLHSALEQPRAFVHRDYHSRNLMWLDDARNPGILDFQDAVLGPVTYDLVSLLRDCYIAWPRERVEGWVTDFLAQAGHLPETDPQVFLRWFDRMGAQRHLKAIGIFARLSLRDGKHGYLRDIPRSLDYLTEVSTRDPALAGLAALLDQWRLAERIRAHLDNAA